MNVIHVAKFNWFRVNLWNFKFDLTASFYYIMSDAFYHEYILETKQLNEFCCFIFISLNVRERLIEIASLAIPSLLYGCEIWTLK
jgi:hypothetical protein